MSVSLAQRKTGNAIVENRKDRVKQRNEGEKEALLKDNETKKKEAKGSKMTADKKELIEQEVSLATKQKVARLDETLTSEMKKLDEISDTFTKLLKSLRV